jgi:hypothetical protein
MTTNSEAAAENNIPQESSRLWDNGQPQTSYSAVDDGGREEEQRSRDRQVWERGHVELQKMNQQFTHFRPV